VEGVTVVSGYLNGLDPVHNEFLRDFRVFGVIPLILLVEKFLPARSVNTIPKGLLSDLIHTYEPWLRAGAVSWLVLWLGILMPETSPKHMISLLPGWMEFLIAFLISEITFYFIHRAMHASRWLWEFHRVHHSSVEYYTLMTGRFHFLDLAMFEAPCIVLFSWCGLSVESVFYFSFFRSVMDRYVHSNINGPFWTGFIISSPHFHAWHHSNEFGSVSRNFSRDGVFMDYLMGTAYYPEERRAVSFGDASYSNNYVSHQLIPFINVFKIFFISLVSGIKEFVIYKKLKNKQG
jgi:sterol desaturase/sphingolipid hydroxylase (fatty acid hydroxylase superfamily)